MITEKARNKTRKVKAEQRHSADRTMKSFNEVVNSGRPKRCSVRDIKFKRV